MSSIRMPPVGRIMLVQTIALMVVTGSALIILGTVSAYSVLLGGLISIVPNAYFASKVFRHTGARAMEQIVRSAYLGEIIKLALTGAGFALAWSFVRPLQITGLMGGFLLSHVIGMVALVKLQKQVSGIKS
jgi:ATP synthase protein I